MEKKKPINYIFSQRQSVLREFSIVGWRAVAAAGQEVGVILVWPSNAGHHSHIDGRHVSRISFLAWI